MRKIINLPTNESFFGRYAHLLPTLKASSTIAQLISAMTEIGVLWTIIYVKVSTVLPQFAFWFATIGAILGTLFLELGLRKFVPFSVNAVLYKRFKGLDFVMSVFIFITAGILIFASGALSFNGAKEIVENLSDPPPILTTDGIEQQRASRLKNINSTYQNDVNATKSRFKSQMAAISSSYEAKIAKQKERLKKYERKERNTGLSYRSTKDRINAEIANLKAQKAEKTASLESEQGGILAGLLSTKSSSLSSIENGYSKDIEDIKKKNKKAVDKSERKIENYGLGLGWFTIICLCLFILMSIIIEVIKKGSGMEEVAVPTQFDFEDGVLASAWQAISERVETITRTIIQNFANRTAPPPKPVKPPIVFDKSNAQKRVVKVEFEQPNEQPRITFPPISENLFNKENRPRKVGFSIGGNGNTKVQNLKVDDNVTSRTYSPRTTQTTSMPFSGTNPANSNKLKPTKKTITYSGINNEIPPREYTYSKVTSLISKHKKRVREAKDAIRNGGGDREQKALDNNRMRLRYWEGRIKEFFE